MDLPANRFLAGLRAGQQQYGCWLGLPDPTAAEIAAGAGFDWLLIDHEHAAFEVADVLALLRAMAPYPVAPLVRPVSADPALLKKFLEIGVQTFLLPMIDSAEQAEAAVQALYYPPRGQRGVGTSLARAARWNQVPNYLHRANDEICVLVQAETTRAIDKLDAILAVDGVHGVFVGPSDLAASMGHIGDAGNPAVVAAVLDALRRISAAGKAAGILALDPAFVARCVEAGASFVGVGVDTLLLGGALRQRAEQFSSAD